MVLSIVAQAGLGLLKGVADYSANKKQYDLDKSIANYKNALNEQSYILNSNILEYNAQETKEDFITNALANDKSELVSKGQLATAMAFNETTGNTADILEGQIESAYGVEKSVLAKTYERKMASISFDKTKTYMNKIGGYTFLPSKPSLFNSITSGVLGQSSGILDAYFTGTRGTREVRQDAGV